MEVYTNQPSLQFYTGNWLANTPARGGRLHQDHAGFCLEAQQLPDSPNRPELGSLAVAGADLSPPDPLSLYRRRLTPAACADHPRRGRGGITTLRHSGYTLAPCALLHADMADEEGAGSPVTSARTQVHARSRYG